PPAALRLRHARRRVDRRADRADLRGGQPVPRAVQSRADPAPRRRGAARTGAAREVAAGLAALPSVRRARDLLPGVLGGLAGARVRSVPDPSLRVRAAMSRNRTSRARAGIESRARRVRHLATRYAGSLRARTLDDATAAWVIATLVPGEQSVWAGMG